MTEPGEAIRGEPFVERGDQLAAADRLLDAVGGGDGRMVVVEGAAGTGKTRLLREIGRRADARALTVLRGRGAELERGFAFGLVRQVLEPLVVSSGADDLLAGSAKTARAVFSDPAGIPSDPQAVLNGLYWLLSAVAQRNPVVVLLDDAHWADESSLRFLDYLGGRIEALDALVIVAARPPSGDPSDAVLGQLATQERAWRLGTLGAGSVATLAEHYLGEPPAKAFVDACLATTGGNPFLLVQLLEELRTAAVRPTRERAAEVARVNPADVARAVAARLARAGPEAAALAAGLAVAGDGTTLTRAAVVAGLEAGAVASAADALAAAALLADDRGPPRFAHPLLRTAVLGGLSPGRRLRLHTTAAELLQREGAPAERIAAHLLETDPRGDHAAAAVLVEAGRVTVARGAPALGARLFARALAEPPAPATRLRLLDELGHAELAAGLRGAHEHLQTVVQETEDPVQAARVLCDLVWSIGPRPELARPLLPALDAAITALEPRERELVLELEFVRLGVLFLIGEKRAAFTASCRRFADLPGATAGECAVLTWVARQQALDPDGTAAAAAALAERAATHRHPHPLWAMQLTLALLDGEGYARAEDVNTASIDAAVASGSASGFAAASAQRALVRVASGNPRGAEADARAAIDSRGLADVYPYQAVIPLTHALTDQARFEDAHRLLAEAGYDGPLPAARPFTALLSARGRLRAASGDTRGAAADLNEALDRLQAAGAQGITGLDTRLEAALALHALGDTERARELADEALATARRWGGARALGGALRVSGLLEGGSDGLARLLEATTVLQRSPARLWHAEALLDLGAALRRANRRRDAREPLKQAVATADACGAAGLADRARQELKRTGARVPVRDGSGVDALTPSERRIVELAAGGVSNAEIAQRLFVTVKTVEMHLTASYRKLDVGARSELAQVLATSSR